MCSQKERHRALNSYNAGSTPATSAIQLILCRRCKEAFEIGGRKVKRSGLQIKEPCDICKRFGFEYTIGEAKRE